eukprot:scaffold1203_cov117-Cylindrotheca_fusiformis.AAC.1
MAEDATSGDAKPSKKTTPVEDMSLLSITDGENDRGIPVVKFISDVDSFANSFTPPATAELMIGAYSELHSKFKTFETTLTQKKNNYLQKIPDIEKSLSLIKHLVKKKEENETATTRYNLADSIYGKAEIDCSAGIVNLWLGANVMLEYTYEEAIDFLAQNEASARKEFQVVKEDLAFVRDQIVTSEVSMTRIFNWDVRKRREEGKE